MSISPHGVDARSVIRGNLQAPLGWGPQGSVCQDAAVGGPFAEFFDLFVHQDGKRPGLGQFGEQMSALDFGSFLECGVHRSDDGLFQFGAVEADAGGGELFQIEDAGGAFAPFQVNGQDAGASFGAGEVDEEDFIESTFTHQLRGQGRDVVGRGHDEDRVSVVLHPGEQGSEHALGQTAVG